MSYDFATNQVCTHKVAFESVDLDTVTRQYAKFEKPPSSSDVQVYVDRTPVPAGGLFSYATLPFSRPAPYRIKRGVNDLVYLSIGFEQPRFYQITPGSVTADDMASGLQRQIQDLEFGSENRHVVVSTRQPVRGTGFQFHDPRWTDKTSSLPNTARTLAAYRELGIIPGRAATGTRLFPGWKVAKDPTSPLVEDRRIVFDDPLPNADPVIELSYPTAAQYCRRCHGTKIEFDYSVKDGTYETVANTDLLAQEFDKFLITRIGSHWKWNWLGSGLVDRIGGKGSTGAAGVAALVTVDISQAFASYQSIKTQQDTRFPQQAVSDAEFPLQLSAIDVQQLPDDPTIAVVLTTVVSRSRVPVELGRVVGNPSPFTLTGEAAALIQGLPTGNFRFRG